MSLPLVYRRPESKRLVVLAVLHTARDPSIWPQADARTSTVHCLASLARAAGRERSASSPRCRGAE